MYLGDLTPEQTFIRDGDMNRKKRNTVCLLLKFIYMVMLVQINK